MDRRLLGTMGENLAADYLQGKGYRIVKRNYRCCYGEIDIIAERDGDMAFVEVKTRSSFQFGRPCEVIDEKKKQHIRKTAHCFLEELKEKRQRPRRYGFHVLEIVIEHTENAF